MTKKIEKELKNMQIRVPKRAHDRSLERAMAGISEARKHGSGQRNGKKIAAGVAGTLVAASIGGILVLSELGGDPTPVPGDNEPVENNVGVENDGVENEAVEDNAIEEEVVDNEAIDDADEPEVEDTEPSVEIDAPETKEIVTMQEGMEQTDTYQLVNPEGAPFITYLPEMYELEINEVVDDASAAVYVNEPDGTLISKVNVMYFHNPMSEEEFDAFGEDGLTVDPDLISPIELDEPWVYDSYVIDLENGYVQEVYLGNRGDHYFTISSEFILEAAEGWASVRDVIFDEWVWTDTGEGLERE